jgi:polyhydroxyalkanoate synthesis regulator phasin
VSTLRPITAAAIEQVRKDLMDALTELAYQVKSDFLYDRERIEQLRERIGELEQRINLADSH